MIILPDSSDHAFRTRQPFDVIAAWRGASYPPEL
jgi:hypothetical protein